MLNAETILKHAVERDLESIVAACRTEIALTAAKHTGGASLVSRIKAAKRYIKTCQPERQGAFYIDGKQAIVHGHTAIMLNEPLPDMPECTRTLETLPKLIAGTPTPNTQPFAPIYTECKQIVAYKRAKLRTNTFIDINESRYDAQYLLDIAAVLGGTITFGHDATSTVASALIQSENGTAIIMPVRK